MKRVFLIVLDSFGIGHAPDADRFGDAGSDTLRAVYQSEGFSVPNMEKLGLYHIEETPGEKTGVPLGAYGRMTEQSRGKDTTIGHWELMGIYSDEPLPVYPEGFPEEVLAAFSAATATIRAAFRVHCSALGWGENTMALPDFRAIMAL